MIQVQRNYFRLLILVAFFGIIAFQSKGQSETDSLKFRLRHEKDDSIRAEILNRLGYIRRIERDSALAFNDNAIALASERGNGPQLQEFKRTRGMIFQHHGELDSAIWIFTSLIPEDSLQYTEKAAWLFGRLAAIARQRGQYDLALRYYLQSLDIDRIYKPERQIETLSLMSLVYNDWHDCQKGVEYGWKAKAMYEHLKPKLNFAIFNRLGVLHMCLRNYDSAIYYYDKDYGSRVLAENDEVHGIYHHNIAYVLETKGDKRGGINRYRLALSYKEKYNTPYSRSLTYHAIAEVYYEMAVIQKKKLILDSGIYFANKALDIAVPSRDLRMIKKCHGLLADMHAYSGHHDQYIIHHELFMNYTDSLFNSERTGVIAEMESRYKLKEKESENLMLSNKNLINAAVIQRQNYFFIGGAAIIAFITGGLYLAYRSNRKFKALNQQIAESNKTKDRLFSIISHDLRGPIAAFETTPKILKSYLNKNQPEKVAEMVDLIDQSAKNVHQLLDNLLNWSLSQKNELVIHIEKLAIKPILDEAVALFKDAAGFKGVSIQSNISDQHIMADRNTFSTVIRNLLSNAIKFSHQGSTITIDHRIQDNWIEFSFTDTGVGMTDEQLQNLFVVDKSKVRSGTAREKGTGLGMVLVKEFVTMNQGKISVQSKPDQGTTFYLSLPLAS